MSDDEGNKNSGQNTQPPQSQHSMRQGGTNMQPNEQTHSLSNTHAFNTGSELQSVNAKITMPEFWHQNIRVWFQQVEAQFSLFRIQADITKYNLLLTQLKPNVLTQVSSLVENPPENNKYDALKNQLISVFADSEQRRIKTLLSGLQLGTRKPSHLLNEQRQIAGNLISDQMLKSLWISQLPQHVQAVVVAAPGSLDDLASIADKILDMVPDGQYAASVSHSPTSSSSKQVTRQPQLPSKEPATQNLSRLEAQIAELAMQVKELRSSRDHTRYPSNQFRNQRRRSSQSNSRKRSDICWYHYRFGQEARKCNPPCKFVRGNLMPSENS